MRSRDLKELENFRDYIFYLNKALNLLPVYEKSVYRAIDGIVSEYRPGMVITWNSFSSATSNPSVAIEFMGNLKYGTLFMIAAKNARTIKDYSAHPEENEILFPPNSYFMLSDIGKPVRNFIEGVIKKELSGWVIYQLLEL